MIPYGDMNAISLIALLRMGIVDDMKANFYNQFLHLPLYEDMAPWNIGSVRNTHYIYLFIPLISVTEWCYLCLYFTFTCIYQNAKDSGPRIGIS